MSEFQYIDGVGNVSVVGGMAHIDLVVVRPPAAEGQKPRVEPVEHLVMTLPQFVRLCAEMARQLQLMEAKGLITRRPAESVGDAAATTAVAPLETTVSSPPAELPPASLPVDEPVPRPGGFFRRR